MFREEICTVVLLKLLKVRVVPLHCAGPVQPGCSSRASSSRWDLCSTRSFLVHVIHNLALPHDVLQHRLVFELFLREDVSHCKAITSPNLSWFRSSPCSSRSWLSVSHFSWFFWSISDCAPISMLVSIHSTSSLRKRGFWHSSPLYPSTLVICVCMMLLFVTSSEFFTVWTLFFISATCFFSTWISVDFFTSFCCSSQQLLYVVLCVLRYTTLLRTIRVVLGLRCCLSLLCDLFEIDLLNLDDFLSVLCWWPSAPAILLIDGMRFLFMRARMPSPIFWSSGSTFATYSFAYDACCSLSCFLCCVQCVPLWQQPQLQTELPSEPWQPSRSQPPSHVFRSSASLAAIDLASSAICSCLLHRQLFLCHLPFNSAVFCFLTSISVSISTWCSLAFSETFNSCCAAMRWRLSVSLLLVIGPISLFETLFSSYVSACSWHCRVLIRRKYIGVLLLVLSRLKLSRE